MGVLHVGRHGRLLGLYIAGAGDLLLDSKRDMVNCWILDRVGRADKPLMNKIRDRWLSKV